MSVNIWLSRPGTASIFSPSTGTHQAWITSVEEVMTRIGVLIGRTRRLSTSRSRGRPVCLKSSSCTIYESISIRSLSHIS